MMTEKQQLEAALRIYCKYWYLCSRVCAREIHLVLKEVSNCLVIVTRYFGGIHLGPDRFKHINQAARNALEMGGFLDDPGAKRNTGRSKKR
jgi:hypothetical protein